MFWPMIDPDCDECCRVDMTTDDVANDCSTGRTELGGGGKRAAKHLRMSSNREESP